MSARAYHDPARECESPTVTAALAALRTKRRGPATEADTPRRRGSRPRVHEGQIDIFGNVHGCGDVVDPVTGELLEDDESAAP